MKVSLFKVWNGDVTQPPKEQAAVVPVKYAEGFGKYDPLFATAIEYDYESRYRVTLSFKVTYDGGFVQKFNTDLPIANGRGVITLKAMRIPQYQAYRKEGMEHIVNVEVTARENGVIFNTDLGVVGSFGFKYKVN